MMYSARIDIGAPPSRVFTVLTDLSLLKLWTPEVIEAHWEGELGVGAVNHAQVKEFGRKFPVRMVVTRYEKDTAIGFEMTTPMWTGNAEYLLTSRPQGTTLELLFKPVSPKGWKRIPALVVAKATRPMVQRIHRTRLEACVRSLKLTRRKNEPSALRSRRG